MRIGQLVNLARIIFITSTSSRLFGWSGIAEGCSATFGGPDKDLLKATSSMPVVESGVGRD